MESTLHAELLQQWTVLKEAYVQLLNDQDVLLNWGKPQLEALYATRIGRWQIELLQVQLQVKALKRKIELVTSARNRELVPDLVAIELTVASELAEAERHIMQETGRVEAAKHLLANLHSPQRSAELRTVYRRLARSLHPDVLAARTEEQERLWLLVQAAYKEGDLEKLKAMELVYAAQLQAVTEAEETLSVEQLQLQCATLKEGIRVLQERILALRGTFPFTMEAQLKDDDWVAAQVEAVQASIAAARTYEEELRAEYATLTRDL